ncbi:homoserine dehydrogenase [Thermospira aquatica]|uniref:Homoserine dehydrogenase n=1 Tax=Thermospira aquatica TaxID=2828656 RepID=A0AAX3BC74_9SPIR|nr:homoserine dehydrogenase [Thermospira aquatica]URA09884.1 homoserine dehydrogenase [Thermospira aquatica]
MKTIGIAVVGFGTIGSGVVKILQDLAPLIEKRTGIYPELRWVVDKDITSPRSVKVEKAKLTTDYKEALADPSVEVVVELVGGKGFAYTLIEESLKGGKHVVTANKALLAERGQKLFMLAKEMKKSLLFEASVGGGIPILRTISHSLVGDRIRALYAIVNGTTNYVLTQMALNKSSLEDALKEAQRKGFAEADPTLDMNGDDAAHKLAILATLAFHTELDFSHVHYEGIEHIALEDILHAERMGYTVKLLAIGKRDEDNRLELRVHPTLVPKDNQLAFVHYEYNAILVESEYLGTSMYYGKGAGSHPTATAVVADIMAIAEHSREGNFELFRPYQRLEVKSMDEITSRYYIRFHVLDQTGVLAQIASIFGKYGISIASVLQPEQSETTSVPLIMTTHEARERNMRQAMEEISRLSFIQDKVMMIRIMDGH